MANPAKSRYSGANGTNLLLTGCLLAVARIEPLQPIGGTFREDHRRRPRRILTRNRTHLDRSRGTVLVERIQSLPILRGWLLSPRLAPRLLPSRLLVSLGRPRRINCGP